MAAKTKSAAKTKNAGTVKSSAKKGAAKKKPGLLAKAAAVVKNIGARRAKRQAKVVHFVADNMIVGKEGAQKLAKKADARAARRDKAAKAANRKAK